MAPAPRLRPVVRRYADFSQRADGPERAQALWSSASLAEVAAQAGYADQAHLSREVRALTGRSPAALRAEREAAMPVPNVQDREPAFA